MTEGRVKRLDAIEESLSQISDELTAHAQHEARKLVSEASASVAYLREQFTAPSPTEPNVSSDVERVSDELHDAVLKAWLNGAQSVHTEWANADDEERRYLTRDEHPDFTESAHDYTHDVRDNLAAITALNRISGWDEVAEAWQPIETAPKTPNLSSPALDFLAWCPDPTASTGGDRRIVWWESGMGCWYGDRDLEERPTHWQPLPDKPLAMRRASQSEQEG